MAPYGYDEDDPNIRQVSVTNFVWSTAVADHKFTSALLCGVAQQWMLFQDLHRVEYLHRFSRGIAEIVLAEMAANVIEVIQCLLRPFDARHVQG